MNAVIQRRSTDEGEMLAVSNMHADLFAEYPELLTPAHIASITGMTVQYVRTLCRKGKLPAVQIGESRWYVPKVRFVEFVMGGSVD